MCGLTRDGRDDQTNPSRETKFPGANGDDSKEGEEEHFSVLLTTTTSRVGKIKPYTLGCSILC